MTDVLAGTTTHYQVYYASTLSAERGLTMAADWVKVIEQDSAFIKSWWTAVPYPSFRVKVTLADPDHPPAGFPGPDSAQATWSSDDNNHTYIYSNISFQQIRQSFIHEVTEQFEDRSNNGWFAADAFPNANEGSTGEALAQVAAREWRKQLGEISDHPEFVLSYDWLTHGRPDFVNNTVADYGSRTDWTVPVGCSVLFIHYLHHLGYSFPQICAAGASTLRGVYKNLTGKTTDPFPTFKSQLDVAYPTNDSAAQVRHLWDDWDPYPLITPDPRYALTRSTQHFRIFADVTFDTANGDDRINSWVFGIEPDFKRLQDWWGTGVAYSADPVNVWLDNPANPNNPYPNAGAYWGLDPNFGTHVNSNPGSPVSTIRGEFVAELMEHFEKIQNKGWFPGADGRGGNEGTNGEALSIIASREIGKILNEPIILKGSGWAEDWLNSPRPDFVNTTTPDYGQAPGGFGPALGCGVLFINWLKNKGYTMAAISQAAAPTLRGVYQKLTGDSTNPFPIFKAELDKAFPPGTQADLSKYTDICDPYPLAGTDPNPNPNPGPDANNETPAVKGYTAAGATQHFRVYYSNDFADAATARARALQWVDVVERDFTMVNTWFRDVDYLSGPVSLYLDQPTTTNISYGYGGAYWLPGKQFETHVKVTLDADFAWLRSGFMAEVSEQFMKLQDRGWFHPDVGLEGTNGEALSLVCARELEKAVGASDVVKEHRWYEPIWLNETTRTDWVNRDLNDYSKPGGDEAVGCGLLFLHYLMYELGYSLQDVIVAAAPTLRQVYRNLTNDPDDPYPAFAALLETKYPTGTKVPDRLPDDGFPINPAPTRFPGNEYVPVPDATVNGYIDGLTINGATSQFTSATEFSQYATGDVIIPPVTSGSPIAAIDLCWQLAGNNRLTYFMPRDAKATYWSLQGHEAAFNPVTQKIVAARDESVYRLFHEKVTNGVPQGTVYRCWRVRDSYNAQGWASYGDGIYSTSGQGSSVSLRGGTRTHLVMTTRPGDSPVRVTFGTDFSHLGFGPNGEKEGFGKYFNISLDNTSLKITAGYRKVGGAPVEGVTATTSTLPLNVTKGTVVQLLIGLEWTDAHTFTVQATAALPDFTLVTTSLVMSSTGVDPFSAPWSHTGAIRGLFVQTVQVGDDGLNTLVGPYEAPLPLRSTLQDWGLQPPSSLILGMTGSVWDYLTQVAVARQVDIRNVDGTIVVSAMRDVTFMSYLWDPVRSPSMSFGLDNTSKFIEVVRNRAAWAPTGVTVYDSRKTGDSYTVTPGTTTTFNVTAPAGVGLFYTPAPVGGPSSLTDADIAAVHTGTNKAAVNAANAKAYADALRDYNDFVSPTAHIFGAYCISGTFGDFPNHSMPAAEWVSYGGSVEIIPTDTPGSVTVSVTAPVIPGWTGDYLLGLHGDQDYPMVRLVGTGVTSTEETLRFATGANAKFTTTEVGSTITNVAATSLAAVNNLATRAVNDASGPSMQLGASISMAEVRSWGASVGSLPGSTLLYRNVQWRILSATISNASVDITAVPYTTYTSAYWAYNWGDLTMNDFQFYWDESRWDDYKVAPLNGAIAEWSNTGATVKHTLFPTPDPNDPSVPLMPSDSLLPGRFVLPYAGSDPNVAAFPSETLFPGQ